MKTTPIELLRGFNGTGEPERQPLDIRICGNATIDTPPEQYEVDAQLLFGILRRDIPAGTMDRLMRLVFATIASDDREKKVSLAAETLYKAYRKRTVAENP